MSSGSPTTTAPSMAEMQERMAGMEKRMEMMEEMLGVDMGEIPAWISCASAGSRTTAITSGGGSARSHRGSELLSYGTPMSTAGSHEGAKYQLTVDGEGNVVYHGLTSWSNGPNVIKDGTPSLSSASTLGQFYGTDDPALAPIFQVIATSKHISVAPDLGNALLDSYFCYQVFHIVERTTFLRHMALGGPMFSEFLLMSVYASATRRIDGLDTEQRKTQSELFERLAKEYLSKELEGPSKMTTIQGLLLLSGHACSLGNISQGWNYAGLLGIHVTPEKTAGAGNLSPEELANRDRLFWAAFIWDKSISLALGREPTFPPRVGRDPSTMQDFDDDEAPWTAYFANPLNCPPQLANYVYQPTRRVASFRYLGQLCLILHDVIMELYSTESQLNARQRAHFITKTCRRLGDVWNSVPDNMKFTSRQAPPPWIFVLQMVYHATSILVYRLVIDLADISSTEGNVGTCLQHSITANRLAVSFTDTFGERMTYVGMYSSFVAASFDLVLLESHIPDVQLSALVRLVTWLCIMEKCAKAVPSMRPSTDHIANCVWIAVSKNTMLAVSEPGQQIMALHSKNSPPVVASFGSTAIANTTETGLGAFDFFDMFAPITEPLGL